MKTMSDADMRVQKSVKCKTRCKAHRPSQQEPVSQFEALS